MSTQTNSRQRIPTKLRTSVLQRDNFTCRMCGQTLGDRDPYDSKPVRIGVGLIVPTGYGGGMVPDNARALCSTCKRGLDRIPYAARLSYRELLCHIECLRLSDMFRLFKLLARSRRNSINLTSQGADLATDARQDTHNVGSTCSTCDQGSQITTSGNTTIIWLLSQIRRATFNEQRDCYEWLRTKFEGR